MSSLLPWLLLIPLIGGLVCWPSHRLGDKAPRWVALVTMLITLIVSVCLWAQGHFTLSTNVVAPQWQFEFVANWIPRFGITFHLAIDGLSILMVVLTAFLGLFAVLCTWKEQHQKLGLFHLAMMWTVFGVIGVFTAVDLFLFFLFWEIMIIPMYFMIALWGNRDSTKPKRFSGATKFLIYTQASGLLMLAAILGLVITHFNATHVWTFDYNQLMHTPMSSTVEFWIMLGFFVAFAVKMPIFPVHGWLADAHEEAPTAGSVDISGLLLKTAAYGMLRFSLPLFPHASAEFAPVAMWLGVIGIFYGAWLAFGQNDIKRLIAYTSVSHMGVVMVAIFSGSVLAYQGAVVQMIAHGLSAAGLFIVCGQIYERLKTRDLREMGGLWKRIRYLPALTMFFAVATLGMPATGNFVGEFMMFFGSFHAVPVIIVIATFGVVFASIYSLMMMQRAFYGAAKSETLLAGMSVREFFLLFVLVVLLVVLGVFPQPVLDTSHVAVGQIQQWFSAASSSSMPLGM